MKRQVSNPLFCKKKLGGFTLLEMVLTVSLVSIVGVMIISAIQGLRYSRQVDNTAAEILSTIYLAKQSARSSGRPTKIVFQTRAKCYFISKESKQCINDRISWKITSSTREKQSEQEIIFYSNGSSSGGEIVMGDTSNSIKILVSWLTGAIKITKL